MIRGSFISAFVATIIITIVGDIIFGRNVVCSRIRHHHHVNISTIDRHHIDSERTMKFKVAEFVSRQLNRESTAGGLPAASSSCARHLHSVVDVEDSHATRSDSPVNVMPLLRRVPSTYSTSRQAQRFDSDPHQPHRCQCKPPTAGRCGCCSLKIAVESLLNRRQHYYCHCYYLAMAFISYYLAII